MNRYLIFIVAFFMLGVSCLDAQSRTKRSNYQLLWRISGHGLKSPSYLFGTMHVYNNRAFDFSDSVLLKISACEAFALETHPDSAMSVVISRMFQNLKSDKNRFKELLNSKDYKELDSLLEEKTGYTLDNLKSPALAEMLLEQRNLKRDKSTFVDAYLFNIAKRQGKLILGLEDVEQQFSMLDEESSHNVKEKMRAYLKDPDSLHIPTEYKNLLNLYYEGDIDEIRKFMKLAYQGNPSGYDKLITQRNLGMAANIAKEIAAHSTFIAVGVGHLPGEEGLINLLRKKGYSVTRVEPKFTGLAKKYKYVEEPETWYTYESNDGAYSINMPLKPKPLKIDSLGITFQIGIDMGTAYVYQSTFITTNNRYSGKSPKEVFDDMENNFKKSKAGKLEKGSDVVIDGLPAREFVMAKRANLFKTRLILRGDIVYMVMVGPTREAINSSDAAKFFKSFKIKPFNKEAWQDFSDAEGAFSIKMLGDVKKRNVDSESSDVKGQQYHLHIYYSIDPLRQETYLIRYNDFPMGYLSLDDSIYYNTVVTSTYQQMQGSYLQQKEITTNRFKATEFTFDIGKQGFVKGQVVLRGSRTYLLLTTSTKGTHDTGIHDFINSLTFKDYKSTSLQEFEFKEDGIKLKFPSAYSTDTTKEAAALPEKKRKVYSGLDINTGVPYMYIFTNFSEYDQYDDKKAFFESINDRIVEAGDSILSKKDLTSKDYFGQEVALLSKKVNTVKKLRTIVNGRKIYQLFAYLPPDYLKPNTVADEFLNSVQITDKDSWNLFSDKTDRLLQDLSSKDTLLQQAADRALADHKFKTTDRTKIYQALLEVYPDDEQDYNSTKFELLRKLKTVSDTSTIAFIKKFYGKLSDSSKLKSHALSVLSQLKTQTATRELMHLILNDHTKQVFRSYLILYPYYDSIALTASILSELPTLTAKFDNPSYLFNLAKVALDSAAFSDTVANNLIRSLVDLGIKKTSVAIKIHKTDSDYYETKAYWNELADVLGSVPFTTEVKNILLAIHQSGDPDIMITTATLLAKNNIVIDAKDFEKIATKPDLRLKLYENLKGFKKEKLYPAKFLSLQKISESALVEYLEYDDEEVPDHIEYMTTKVIEYKGQKQNLLVFKFKYGNSDDWYIGLSGPYPIKSNELVLRGDITFSTYEVYTKDTKLNDVIKNALKDYSAELVQ